VNVDKRRGAYILIAAMVVLVLAVLYKWLA
jgi:hypothetical protein